MTKNFPTVSVCMITYNHEKFIAKAIDSVLMQKCSFSYELIIGEDFSSDNTLKICKNYVSKYPDKIKLLSNPQNIGMMPNFINTLKMSNGKYIALLEGDDYWTDPYKLQKQIDFLEKNISYIASCHNVLQKDEITNSQKIMKQEQKETDISIKKLAAKNIIITLSLVFKNNKNIIKHFIHFITHYPDTPVGDYVLNLFLSQTGKIRYFPQIMGVYRIHYSNSFSSSLYNDDKRIAICISMINLIDNLKKHFNKENLTIEFNQQQKEYLEELYRFRIKYKRQNNKRKLIWINKQLLQKPILRKNRFRIILSSLFELIFLKTYLLIKKDTEFFE